MLTVSPNRQYCGMMLPTTPATTGPVCKPVHHTIKLHQQQESPSAWTQEAYRPARSKYMLWCSGWGVTLPGGTPCWRGRTPGRGHILLGYPPSPGWGGDLGWGYPPSPPTNGGQSENITSRRITYAGGNKKKVFLREKARGTPTYPVLVLSYLGGYPSPSFGGGGRVHQSWPRGTSVITEVPGQVCRGSILPPPQIR